MDEVRMERSGEEMVGKRPAFLGRVAVLSMGVLGAVLALGFALAWRTNDVMGDLPFLGHGATRLATGAGEKQLVDETPWKTASTVAALAVTQEELTYARDAERLADHEVDQSFATALRKANLQQRTLTGNAAALQGKVTQLEAMVASDQAALDAVVKGSDDEQVDRAQLGLDQDQLNDAKGDLARASGDQRGAIQQQLTAHETEMKAFDATSGAVGQVATLSVRSYRTLAGLVGAWSKQRQRYHLLVEAKAEALQDAATLTAEHDRMESNSGKQGAAGTGAVADRVAGLKRMSLERQLMSLYDDRVDTDGQLADVYGRWGAQVLLQHRIVEHLIVVQGMMIPAILLAAIVLGAGAKRLAEKETLDKRRMRTLSWIALLVVQVAALVGVLLVIFGPPAHLSTVVGLVTAGLTVALQDFILAFVGWFILMGRTGIGVGDSVEINSVAGEVVEIGLFRTTLMETGNWTAKGHPTGRRVAFNNKYAISGQYFNFSTAGQWMWDELTVPVPTGEDMAGTIERVQRTVLDQTESDARKAGAEWAQASQRYGFSQYSAESAVNIRPTAAGVDLVVRYVTKAAERFERRNALYQCLVEALRAPKAAESA